MFSKRLWDEFNYSNDQPVYFSEIVIELAVSIYFLIVMLFYRVEILKKVDYQGEDG